jgi:meso-butanediol dehydrogenase / (S,S)-butanediol dehydrogenase / diacetyl reductase
VSDGYLLRDKLAFVTGAASGIGRAIALAYAQAGARVVLTDRNAPADALEEVLATGAEARAWQLDVSDVDAVRATADRVGREVGTIDILVNSAGLLIREGIDSPQAHEHMKRIIDVNLIGTFNTIHAFVPALRRTRGCVVNIASCAAFIAQRDCVGYSASKGGVKMLTQAMAADLAGDGIRVNAIAPGVIETPMTRATLESSARLQQFLARIPAKRVGRADEIALPAVFLASVMASYVTGVTLPVDGGLLAV